MKFAIIETGGKQYKVSEGAAFHTEKLPRKEGDKISFDKVLLFADGEKVTVGTPYISGASVSADLTGTGRARKVTTIKYKAKSRYFKKRGHRQPYSEVKVEVIKVK